ncbi:hypothetical protein ACTFIY_001255 [Dictyostelium cf. discoideum]
MVFNRIFGIPNDDKVSLKKYRIKIFEYVLLVLSFAVMCYYVIERNTTNRVVSITADYQEKINPPHFYIIFNTYKISLFFLYSVIFNRYYYDEKGNYVTEQLVNCVNNNKLLVGDLDCRYTINSTFLLISQDFVGYYSTDEMALREKEFLEINVVAGYFDFGVPSFPISVFFGDDKYYSDSTQQFTLGTSKKIIKSFGDEKEVFINSVATSNSKQIKQSFARVFSLSYSIYFNDVAVITEKTESNFELAIRILSDIGSYIAVLITVVGIICSRVITRLLIKDKGGWLDTQTHECITYHYDQIKLKNYEMYKMGLEGKNPTNENVNNSNIDIDSNSIQNINS